MSTLSISRFTEQQKVKLLAEAATLTSENETFWVSFNQESIDVFKFSNRLDVFEVEGLKEIYTVQHEDVHFLGYLINGDWKDLKLNNDPVKIAKLANRKAWSGKVN